MDRFTFFVSLSLFYFSLSCDAKKFYLWAGLSWTWSCDGSWGGEGGDESTKVVPDDNDDNDDGDGDGEDGDDDDGVGLLTNWPPF